MNISVIGCGRWGSFIAWYLNKINHNVILYGRSTSENLQTLRNTRTNGILSFDDKILITDDLQKAINSSEIIVISIGAQSLRNFLKNLPDDKIKSKKIVLCMKGIEVSSGKRLTEVTHEIIGKKQEVAIWVGPGHVQDFHKGIPNCMVIDSQSQSLKEELVSEFSSELIRFYLGNDLIGNEIGAASKNVIGIAAGMLDGLGYTSLKGALMSRATREIARLIKEMGGSEISAYGLCHLGDYEATLFSKFSNNRQFGENFVLGKKYEKLAEGVFTTKAIVKLADEYKVDLPICNAVNDVVNFGKDPRNKISDLFLRKIKHEF